jgi:hypothetical protein
MELKDHGWTTLISILQLGYETNPQNYIWEEKQGQVGEGSYGHFGCVCVLMFHSDLKLQH